MDQRNLNKAVGFCCLDLLGRSRALFGTKPQGILVSLSWLLKKRYICINDGLHGSLIDLFSYFSILLWIASKGLTTLK